MNILRLHSMHTKTALLFVFMSIALSLATSVQAGETVRVGGAGSGLGVMKILAAAFETKYPGTKIEIMPNLGSSGGIKALLHGAVDIAISGRPLKAEEQKDGIVAVECARTPFLFAVHKSMSKVDVTNRELERIYKGQLTTWPDGTRIRLILRPVNDTDTTIVKNISKEMELAVNAANARPEMIFAVTDQEAVDLVAKIPGAIGAVTLMQLETEKSPVKALSFNNIKPTLDTLAKGRYQLSKSLYLVSTPKSHSAARQFIQFVRSAHGRAILSKSGALPSVSDQKI